MKVRFLPRSPFFHLQVVLERVVRTKFWRSMTLEGGRRVITAAEKKAKEIGRPMNIAVADEGRCFLALDLGGNGRR